MGSDQQMARAYAGGRVTPSRRAIALTVAEQTGAFTVDALAAAVRARDAAAGATATVYRAVAAMESAGYIERVGTRGGAALFVRCDAESHHHHVVCDGCGRIAHADCPLPSPSNAPDGFTVTRHEVTLYGLCPDCADKGRGA